MTACVEHAENDIVSDDVHNEIKSTTQTLVAMFDEATDIVDFFLKPDEVRPMKREIKRAILDCSFGNKEKNEHTPSPREAFFRLRNSCTLAAVMLSIRPSLT